jgi:23S rRNA pseudouridine1911/1915/1917 synthase
MENRILFEDNHLIVVNKLPGEIVQSDKTGDEPLSEKIKSYLKVKYSKPGKVFLGVVHRLDRPVSGTVVFARTSKALARMNALLQKREFEKIYWAVVSGQPPSEAGTLEGFLRKNEALNKSFVVQANKGKHSLLHYRWLGSSQRYHLLEIRTFTGRHHQIRVLLSHAGMPIKGDLKYGAARNNPDGSIHLHAMQVRFRHPVTQQPLCLSASPPDDPLWNYFYETIKPHESKTPAD